VCSLFAAGLLQAAVLRPTRGYVRDLDPEAHCMRWCGPATLDNDIMLALIWGRRHGLCCGTKAAVEST
jgi:hypothetical protein